ncbi:ATP-binding protein [Shewanella livingstonensis]|uniref:histidine kinase n=1 Tax=Shewanella livingstonensis TaxID=150120 RepID=A0A3G8LW60_9GAMM|nr:ATP-binding protein [Shewanella livingstonensis]AZG72930.1 HAMP domain-containing protein [Shewanella livingstonensis]
MKISQKLFLAFFGLTTIVLIATLSLARWSFDQGFLDYINGLEQERLQHLSDDLLTLYSATKMAQPDPTILTELQSTLVWQAIGQKVLAQAISHKAPRPKRNGPDGANRPPRPAGNHRPPMGAQSHLGPPGQRPPFASQHFGPPTGLYSAEQQFIAGVDIGHMDDRISLALAMDDRIVGYLYSSPIREVESSSATAFSQQQRWTSLGIGLLCLLLASTIAWWLSRFLLIPVKQVMLGVSYLSQGNYDERLAPKRADELGLLMANIDHLAMTLSKNRSAKNRWLADISHELRTPLSILCGEIDSIKAGIRAFDSTQLVSIEQEVLRMKHLVDDLYELSLSDVGGLRYHLTTVNISESLDSTLVSIASSMHEKGLTLSKQIAPMLFVSADVRRLEQLFINLLMNAMAYTDSPGNIDVQLTSQASTVILTINDTKPSATEAECEHLFEPLYRQDTARTRRGSGAGLGLTICKNIVEAHNGSITATPSLMGGLCIRVQLPLLRKSI